MQAQPTLQIFRPKTKLMLFLLIFGEQLSKEGKFTFNLSSVLSHLICGRILYPSSKLATNELAKKSIEKPNFSLQHMHRDLEVLANNSDSIQAEVYKNSLSQFSRNSKILYYDCTNYFFEIEQESGLKQYGVSKEHKSNPIVQMGLFMDA